MKEEKITFKAIKKKKALVRPWFSSYRSLNVL